MKLVVASNNAGKIREIRAIFGAYFDEIVTMREVGFCEEIDETGTTFAQNAYIKAAAVYEKLGLPTLADDSGLCVDLLGDAPGVYSARYAGPQHNDADNNKKLIHDLSGKGTPWNARFVSAVCMFLQDGTVLQAEGAAHGQILSTPLGSEGFGYDPFFYYPPLKKTFAQLSLEEKNLVSHRKAALTALKEKLDRKI